MNIFRIRLAAITDLDAIMKIEKECFDEKIAFRRRQICRFVNQGSILVAVKEPNWVIGQITILRRSHIAGNHLRIYNLAVLVEQQKQGAAKMLMKTGLRRFVDSRTTRISLEVELGNHAIHWYESLGFYQEKTLEGYYGDNRHGVRMVLSKADLLKVGEE